MNWKIPGVLAALTVFSAASASPIFDGTAANLWVVHPGGETRSYGIGDWSAGVLLNGGLAQVTTDGGGSHSIAVGHEPVSIYVNQTSQSVPLLSPVQIPLALAGLARGSGDPQQGGVQPTVQLHPGSGRYDGTVAVNLRATRGQGVTTPLTLRWRINAGAQQSRSFTAEETAEAQFFLVDNGIHQIEASAFQGSKSSPMVSAKIEIAGADRQRDSDGDGIPDLVELALGMNPLTDDIGLDSDGDGWSDFEELLRGSDPRDPDSKPLDSDLDGWSDFDERLRGTNPNDPVAVVGGKKQAVKYPDRPVARRLYEVETLLSGDVSCAVDPLQLRQNLSGLSAIGFTGDERYDLTRLPDAAQLSDQPRPQIESEVPAHLRRGEAQAALQAGRLPALRLPAGEALILRVTDDQGYRLKRVLPSFADPTPGEVTAWLVAQGQDWTTAQQWLDGYIGYLKARLLRHDLGGVNVEQGASAALIESLLAWQATDAVAPLLIGVPSQPVEPLAVQRLRTALQDNGAGFGMLAERLLMLPELAAARSGIAQALACDAAADSERAAYDKALAIPATARYLSRLLVLDDLQTLEPALRASLIDPAADTDGDALANAAELAPRDFRDPRVADSAAALPTLSARDLRVREAESAAVYLPVVLQLSAPAAQTVRLRYATRDGSALAGQDYVAATGLLVIPAGEREAQFTLEVSSDRIAEDDEHFEIHFSEVEHAVLARSVMRVVIEDAAAAQRTPLAQDDSGSVAPGADLDVDVLANDDGRGAALYVSLHRLPPVGSAQVLADGRIRYTASSGFVGSTTLQYRVENGDGLWAVATVSISSTVQPNTPPVAVDDVATTRSGTSVDIAVLGNDRDADNDVLIVSVVRAPANGTALVLGNGSIRYIPGAAFSGQDSLRYRIDDGRGGSAEAEVRITVEAPPPQVTIADVTVIEPATGQTSAVLTVRLSAPSNKIVTLAWRTRQNTALADVDYVQSSGTLSFLPGLTQRQITVAVLADAIEESDEQFWVELSEVVNAELTRGLATVTIKDGTQRNRLPVAMDDVGTVSPGQSVIVAVLANDVDADGDALTVSLSTLPAHGEAEVLADQRIRYTAAADYQGSDSFRYRISDGRGGSAEAVVRISITEAALAGFAIYEALEEPVDDMRVSHLYRVQLDKPGSVQRLTPDFAENDSGVQNYWISPDGRHLVYLAYVPDGSWAQRLYHVALDAEVPLARPLSPLPMAGASVGYQAPLFVDDGGAVVYLLRRDPAVLQSDLVLTPLDQLQTVQVLVPGHRGDAESLLLAGNGAALYGTLTAAGNERSIIRVPLDGSGLERIGPTGVGFHTMEPLEETADGRWLLYRHQMGFSSADDAGLFAIDLQRPGVVQRLTPDYRAVGGRLGYGHRLVADGQRLLFVANGGERLGNGDRTGQLLYEVPLLAPHVVSRVSPLSPADVVEFVAINDVITYIDQLWADSGREQQLLQVERHLPDSAQLLAGPMPGLSQLQANPDGDGVVLLQRVGGSDDLPGDADVMRLQADGTRQVFGGGSVSDFLPLADGRHLLLIADGDEAYGGYGGELLLTDGTSMTPQRLTPPAPARSRVVRVQVHQPPS